MFRRVNLIIRLGSEVSICRWVLWVYSQAIVGFVFWLNHKVRAIFYLWLDIDEFAHFLADSLVIVQQEVPTLLEERTYVILIILKERRFAVSALQSHPVQMAPIAVIAYADILYKRRSTTFNGHGKSLHTIGSCYLAAITIGLLYETLPFLYMHSISPMQFLIPLHRAKVCCTEQNLHGFTLFNIVYDIADTIPTYSRESVTVGIAAPPDEDRLTHDMILGHKSPVARVG